MENIENNNRNLNNESAVVKNKLRNERKKGLTKGVLTTAIISFIVIIVAGAFIYSFYKKEHNEQLALMERQKTSYSQQLTVRDSTINDWLLTFDQIEKNLNAIKQKENIITIKSSDSEFSKSNREQVLDDIKYINTLLDENKKKIASLNAQLKQSGGSIKGLQIKIASLEASIKQYENDISELKTALVNKDFEIGELNTKMTARDLTITEQNEKISGQTQRLNQAFLVYGTFKDLKGKGIVSKEGGFLGLGRKESLVGNVADSLFAKIDVTATKTIPVNSKDAKFITFHPESSYKMIRESDNKIAYIEIENPEQFWKISKYAVVEIIK